MFVNFLTKQIRSYLVGPGQEFVFKKVDIEKFSLPEIKKIGFYIHIPFCKSLCPFCPYNRIKYDQALAQTYLDAMLKEIDLYYQRIGRVEIASIYIGGGTPTTMIDELGIILKKLKESFLLVGDICIETSVAEINEQTLEKLKNYGVNLLSVGVQSFQDKQLKFLGRNYSSQKIKPAIKLLENVGFKSVNIDLMFALACQTKDDVLSDLKNAVESGVDQVTVYPLFTFPYSAIGKFLKLQKLKMPNIFVRRRMYKTIHKFFEDSGFRRVSVWGFKKGNVPRYSSVTRDYYIGLGAGAASSFQDIFYFNTFSVEQYIEKLSSNKLPVALKMDISDSLSNNYWFYWKLYDTNFSLTQVREVFGKKSKAEKLIRLFRVLNLCKQVNEEILLTEKGAFWIHLMQNYFVLNYINKVWTNAMSNPWPDKIEF
jgi:oxygen-independent coproporphyrinogen III oxidase